MEQEETKQETTVYMYIVLCCVCIIGLDMNSDDYAVWIVYETKDFETLHTGTHLYKNNMEYDTVHEEALLWSCQQYTLWVTLRLICGIILFSYKFDH